MTDSFDGNYKFLGDVDELKFFFDNVLPDLSGDALHSYLMCITVRPKKLTKEERDEYGVSGSDGVMMREEIIAPRGHQKVWNFDNFVSHIYKYECPKRGMITKNGFPYPEKALAVMIYAEPANEAKVGNYILQYGNTISKELVESASRLLENGKIDGIQAQMEKLAHISKKIKSCHAECAEPTFIHFDFDIRKDLVDNEDAFKDALHSIRTVGNLLFGKGNVVIIRTKGGFHTLVKRTSIKSAADYLKSLSKEELENEYGLKGGMNPLSAFVNSVQENYYYTFEETAYDKILMHQAFVPVPGCIHYGDFIVRVENKSDLEKGN